MDKELMLKALSRLQGLRRDMEFSTHGEPKDYATTLAEITHDLYEAAGAKWTPDNKYIPWRGKFTWRD